MDNLQPGLENNTTDTTTAAPVVTETTTVADVETTTTTTVVLDHGEDDDDEWDKVISDAYGDQGDKNETTTTTTESTTSGEVTTSTTTAGTTDTTTETSTSEPNTFARDTRLAQQQYAAAVEATKNDVREKMYKDAPTKLVDSEGDEIKSISDVQKLINPGTGELFTLDEAGAWFLAATQDLNRQIADRDREIDRVANVNVDVKDQADSVSARYGDLLKAQPALRDKLWAQFSATLVTDPQTGIITKAPVNMEDFYDTALEPYVQMGEREAQRVKDEAAAEQQRVDAENERKRKEEEDKQKRRSDRSDIYGRGRVDDRSDEDKEWDAAEESVFGGRI